MLGPSLCALRAAKIIALASLVAIFVVILFDQTLVMRGIRRGNFVVEQAGQDEADGGAAGATDIGKDFLKRRHGHGDDVAKYDNDGTDDGEADVAHVTLRLEVGGLQERARRGDVPVWPGRATWTPAQCSIDRGSAGVHLQWVGEHDKDHDGEAADRGRD